MRRVVIAAAHRSYRKEAIGVNPGEQIMFPLGYRMELGRPIVLILSAQSNLWERMRMLEYRMIR